MARNLIIDYAKIPLTYIEIKNTRLQQIVNYPDKSLFRITYAQNRLNEYFWLVLITSNHQPIIFSLSTDCYIIYHKKLSLNPNLPTEVIPTNVELLTHPHYLYQSLTRSPDQDMPYIFDRFEVHLALPGLPVVEQRREYALPFRFAT